MPKCWIIAGPNGAGKTTFSLEYFPQVAKCNNFINADLIALDISPLHPEKQTLTAGRIFLKEIKSCINSRVDFAFETTLSGRNYLKLIKKLKNDNWEVELIYLALPNVQLSLSRVKERVSHGGHDIPLKDILRRFPRSLSNLLFDYSSFVDCTRCFMNTNETPEWVFEQKGSERVIIHSEFYKLLQQGAKI